MAAELKLSSPYEVRTLISTPTSSFLATSAGPELQGISSTAAITGHTRLSSQRFAGRLVLMRKAPDP